MFVPLYDTNPRRHVGVPFVTWSLLAATVAIHLITAGVGSEEGVTRAAFRFGLVPAVFNNYLDLPRELQGVPEMATPLTYMFLHADWMHLLGNMLFLWVFGDNVEDAMGHVKFLLFYLVCGIAGGLAFALLGPQTSQAPLVGASGAISGVVAAYLMLYPKVKVWVLLFMRIPLPINAAWCLGFWVALQFFNVVFASESSNVAWLAHVGGLAAGAVLVVVLKRSDTPLFGGAGAA
jgi:membrane associated rhomboid family serine protease